MNASAVILLPDPQFQAAQTHAPSTAISRHLPMHAAEAVAKRLDISAAAEWPDLHGAIGDLLGGCSEDGFLADLRAAWEQDEDAEIDDARSWEFERCAGRFALSAELSDRITKRQERTASDWLDGVERLTIAASRVAA